MSNLPFTEHLLADETIVWSGRPRQGLMLTRHDIYLIPFSILWGGFAIFWEAMVLTTKAPGLMALFGVPFVLVGLFITFGRLPFDAWLRGKIHYALTDRRALILREGPFRAFTALWLARLPDVTLGESSDGRGTIRFGQAPSFGRPRGWAWVPSLDPTPQFQHIPDVRGVFKMVQDRARVP